MTISIKQFVENWIEKRKSYIFKNGYQCVDVAKLFNEEVLWVNYGSIGHAKDYFNNLPSTSFEKIRSNGSNRPIRGDIVIWGSSWGRGYGHIAICLAYDDTGFYVLEQNGGTGGNSGTGSDAIRIHKYPNYSGVTGWCRYKNISSIISKESFDSIVHTRWLYIWEATNNLSRQNVANKVFYYLAGYQHSLNNKNASYIWDNSRWNQSATRSELANLILNFKNRVQNKNLTYQDLVNRWIWSGSNPNENVTGVEFTTMIARATAL